MEEVWDPRDWNRGTLKKRVILVLSQESVGIVIKHDVVSATNLKL